MAHAIIFDFWGTLADNGIRSPLKQVKMMLRLYNMGFSEFVQRFETVFMTRRLEALDTAFRDVCMAFGVKPFPMLINDLVGMWNKNWMLAKLYPDTIEGLEKLKERGFKLGLISNTDNFSVERVVEKYDLLKYFDAVVFSYDTGLLKTNPKMFGIMLEKLGVNAEDALMVGDSIESDIEAAKKAGIRGILMDRMDRRAVEEKVLTMEDLGAYLE